MALVDYASSEEESDAENNQNEMEVENKVLLNKPPQKVNISYCKDNKDNSNDSLFSSLPTPKVNLSLLTDNSKLNNLLLNKNTNLVKKQKNDKEGVKISVPSIKDFDDGDSPATKKRKPSVKGVGLFSLLPPPKNLPSKESAKIFVPHTIKKTLNKLNSKVSVKVESATGVTSSSNESDEDEEHIVGSFFGSSLTNSSAKLENPTNNETISKINVTIENNSEATIPAKLMKFTEPSEPINAESTNEQSNWIVPNLEHNVNEIALPTEKEISTSFDENSHKSNEFIPGESNPLALDEKALQILCGNKKKRQQMSMNIIDLSGEEIMPDSKEWLLKQLSQEKRGKSHGHRKHDGPSSQSRRKHQITYLAYQAKEQELELQNQWANNRMSRRQTQSKYGF